MGRLQQQNIGGIKVNTTKIAKDTKLKLKKNEKDGSFIKADIFGGVDIDFESTAVNQGAMISDESLIEKYINPFFTSVFNDYSGAIIFVEPNPVTNYSGINVLIQFNGVLPDNRKAYDPNKKWALEPINKDAKLSTFDELAKINSFANPYGQAERQRIFKLTDEAQEILADFVPWWKESKDHKEGFCPDYFNSNIAFEVCDGTNYTGGGPSIVAVQLQGLSLDAIVAHIFEDKDTIDKVTYNTSYINAIGINGNNAPYGGPQNSYYNSQQYIYTDGRPYNPLFAFHDDRVKLLQITKIDNNKLYQVAKLIDPSIRSRNGFIIGAGRR